jgi:hypothetical protein
MFKQEEERMNLPPNTTGFHDMLGYAQGQLAFTIE